MGRFSDSLGSLSPGNLKDSVSDSVAELFEPTAGEVTPQTFQSRHSNPISPDYEIEKPDENVNEYYRLYEENPIINQSIDNLASEVIEPGWYIDAEDDETIEELTEFLENIAIVANQPKQNFSQLVEMIVTEHEVRGTIILEKVYNDDGRPVALNPLPVSTFEFYTKDDSNILLAPDDTQYDEVKLTEDGEAAAYVQFDDDDRRWVDRNEKCFARDEIIHIPRSPDIGSVTGHSRVAGVFDRALALEAKMRDNDDAIAMKAWPMVLFQMGSDDNPWKDAEMEDFMEDFDAENFGPGLMKAVAGDVSVEEFAGETADIEHAVETDVNFITTGMPGPKYGLGGFVDDVSQTVASAQERQYRKQVRHLRRKIEDKITPFLEEVAEAYNLSTENLELVIGRPDGDMNPEDMNGNIIHYSSDVDDRDGDGKHELPRDGDGDGIVMEDQIPDAQRRNANTRGPDMSSMLGDAGILSHPDGSQEMLADGDECSVAELADSRLVSTTEVEQDLTELLATVLDTARDRALANVRQRTDGTPVQPSTIDSLVEDAADSAISRHQLVDSVSTHLETTSRSTLRTIRQSNHPPQIDAEYASRHQSIVQSTRTSMIRDVRDAVDDMGDTMRHMYEQEVYGDGDMDEWEDRVRDSELANGIDQRAQLIARMRANQVVNRTKLTEYKRHDDVLGVEFINPCTNNTTRLCKHVAGCGARDGVVAYFDIEETIAEQVRTDIDDEMLFDGFMVGIPPFHYGCRTEVIPVTEEVSQ